MHCDGKCYLMKKLNNDENSKSKQSIDSKEVLLFQNEKPLLQLIDNKLIAIQTEKCLKKYSFSILSNIKKTLDKPPIS